MGGLDYGGGRGEGKEGSQYPPGVYCTVVGTDSKRREGFMIVQEPFYPLAPTGAESLLFRTDDLGGVVTAFGGSPVHPLLSGFWY